MSHVWGLFSHPDREMQVINRENETISHHYTHHVLLMAAIPVICAFITNAAGHCLVMRTVINNKPVALVVMDAFGKYTHFADASRLRTWIETGKVMPVPAAALSYKKQKAAQMAAAGQTAQND